MSDEPTDQDLIVDHPFTPGQMPLEPDECGWHDESASLWPCGYGREVHADQEGGDA